MPNTRRSKRLKTKQRSKPAVPVYARPEALNIVLQLLGPYLSTKDLARCALVSKAFSNMARDPLLVPRKLSLRQYFGDFVHFTHHPALFPRFFNKVAPFLLSLDVSDVRDFPLSTLIHIDFPNLESLRLTAYQSRYALYGGSSSVPGEAVRRLLEEPFILPSLKLIFFFSSFISATGCTRGYHIGHDAISIGKHLLNAISKARPQLLTDVAFCEACKTWTAGRQDDGVRARLPQTLWPISLQP